MRNIFLRNLALVLAGAMVTLSSCTKEVTELVPNPYSVPATYNFENTEYSEAAARVSMWQGLTTYLGKSTSRQLSQDTANYLWNNTNTAFTAELATGIPYDYAALNALSFNISSKVADPVVFKKYVDSMVVVSASNGATASEGVAGKMASRLFNYQGIEFNQLVAKGLMGAMVLSEVINQFDRVVSADNNTVVVGQGTAMEHEWDLAFGYVGLPKNYDTAVAYNNSMVNRPLGVGGYFKERGTYIQAGAKVFEAFLRGRAAIAAKDYETRDEAIATIKLMIEKTFAAAAWHYTTAPRASGIALDNKFHQMSEGAGFVAALKYRDASVSPLSTANYNRLVEIMTTSFWTLHADASNTLLTEVSTILRNAYGQLQVEAN